MVVNNITVAIGVAPYLAIYVGHEYFRLIKGCSLDALVVRLARNSFRSDPIVYRMISCP